jgi:hypothetical protein
MLRKFIILLILSVFFAGTSLFAENGLLKNNINDISSIEKRFKAIDASMAYLKNKNVDINDIITLYTESESMFREVKYTSELKDYDMTLKFLSHRLSILEEKTLERVSLAKRMDLMYILMVGMGMVIIVGMSVYSIYMYSRRK